MDWKCTLQIHMLNLEAPMWLYLEMDHLGSAWNKCIGVEC